MPFFSASETKKSSVILFVKERLQSAQGQLKAGMLSHFSRARLSATLWTVVHQAPLSVGFSRHGYWSGVPLPPPGDPPDPGI